MRNERKLASKLMPKKNWCINIYRINAYYNFNVIFRMLRDKENISRVSKVSMPDFDGDNL